MLENILLQKVSPIPGCGIVSIFRHVFINPCEIDVFSKIFGSITMIASIYNKNLT